MKNYKNYQLKDYQNDLKVVNAKIETLQNKLRKKIGDKKDQIENGITKENKGSINNVHKVSNFFKNPITIAVPTLAGLGYGIYFASNILSSFATKMLEIVKYTAMTLSVPVAAILVTSVVAGAMILNADNCQIKIEELDDKKIFLEKEIEKLVLKSNNKEKVDEKDLKNINSKNLLNENYSISSKQNKEDLLKNIDNKKSLNETNINKIADNKSQIIKSKEENLEK